MKEFFTDDKSLVIISILILGLSVIWKTDLPAESAEIIKMFGSGLLGMAIGKGMKG